jgi:cyclohexadieny/prephenate dehydrogenase
MSVHSGHSTFDALVIVGVGLIGGSIAAAVKQRGIARSVIGVGRNRDRLDAAIEAGIIDQAAAGFDAIDAADLVVVCTPVDRIADDVRSAAALGPGTLISDAGSVKGCIIDELRGSLPEGVNFVGAHPMAGSEKTGWENGRADLFVDRLCVLTPDEQTPADAVDAVEQFWQALGMRTERMSPAEHDRAVAATSHVPHVAAAAVVSLIDDSNARLASTGFRDVTRIAAGDPALWLAILQGNKEAVTHEIDRLIQQLTAYRQALVAEDATAIVRMLNEARRRRDSVDL